MSSTVTNADVEKWRQLARYIAHGVSQEAAGAAVGFSPSRVTQLLDDEDFKVILAQETQEIVINYVDTNSAYDKIERKALNNLQVAMEYNRDPDFNMRVALMANRAVRRGEDTRRPTNSPLNAAQVDGQRIAISLSVQLVKNLQQNVVLQSTQSVEVQKAELDAATPQDVSNLLQIKSFNRQQIDGPSPHSELKGLANFLDI